MEIELEKRFAIEAPAAAAWPVLRDIRGVAECMPGAEITERVDDSHYKGQVRVKLGPAVAAFKGDLRVEAVDPGKRTIVLVGRGAEVKGGSAATLHLTAQLHAPAPGVCELAGQARVTLTGKMAAFGGRMMTQVADQILRQFGENFAQRVKAQGGQGMADAPAGSPPVEEARAARPLNAFSFLWRMIADRLRPGRRARLPRSR